jgi:hypothetical protein
MIYALSIDWLSFHCQSDSGVIDESVARYDYERAPHGTRQFKELITCSLGGEDFAEVQQVPCSSVLKERTLIVKFCNRFLYHVNLWHFVNEFLELHKLRVLNLSRVDLCADFNTFYKGLQPISFIKGFLSSVYRHIGRGNGSSYFNHFSYRENKESKSSLVYTGLKFCSKQSAANVYLYNKTYELMTVHDKPHIRKLWQKVGLVNTADTPVWRLEVSIYSKGMRFKNKKTGEDVKISKELLCQPCGVSLIYHTFVRSLFSFVRNRGGITNISREPRLQLFNGEPFIVRTTTSHGDSGDRTEKILIKQLWQMSDKYRSSEILADEGVAKLLSAELVRSCDLEDWFNDKSRKWNKPKRK